MADDKPFSRADLVAISGAPDDAVAFWLRNGLLGSSEREARKHRRFGVREVKLAALFKAARCIGLNISAMRVISGALDEAFRFRSQHFEGMTLEQAQEAIAAQRLGKPASDLLYLAHQFDDCEAFLVVCQTDDGEWIVSAESMLDDKLPTSAAVVFDLGKVLSLDWPKDGER